MPLRKWPLLIDDFKDCSLLHLKKNLYAQVLYINYTNEDYLTYLLLMENIIHRINTKSEALRDGVFLNQEFWKPLVNTYLIKVVILCDSKEEISISCNS